MIIYKITNLINNKIYIGQTKGSIESRWYYHLRDSKNATKGIDAAIRKYGKEDLKIITLVYRDEIDEFISRGFEFSSRANLSIRRDFGYIPRSKYRK